MAAGVTSFEVDGSSGSSPTDPPAPAAPSQTAAADSNAQEGATQASTFGERRRSSMAQAAEHILQLGQDTVNAVNNSDKIQKMRRQTSIVAFAETHHALKGAGCNKDDGVAAVSMIKELPSEDPSVPPGLTFWETVINFVLNLIGAGVLVLPSTMAACGWCLTFILMATAFFTIMKCALITIANCNLSEAMSDIPVKSYEALCGDILGPAGKNALMVSKNSYFSGVIVVYTIMVTDSLGEYFPDTKTALLRWCVTLPIFVLLGMLKDLKQVAKLAPIGVLAAMVQCAAISWGSICQMFAGGLSPHHAFDSDVMKMGAVLSTCVFGCGSIVATVPSVRTSMARVEELPAALSCALAIVFGVYAIVMALTYSAFGDDIESNAMLSINEDCTPLQCFMGKVAAGAILINLCISMPGISFFVISVFEALGDSAPFVPLSLPNIGLRALYMVTLVLIGAGLPYVAQVVGLISATFGCFNVLVLPSVINYRANSRFREVGPKNRDHIVIGLDAGGIKSYVVISIIAVVAMIFGVIGGVQKLVEKIEEAHSTTTTTTTTRRWIPDIPPMYDYEVFAT